MKNTKKLPNLNKLALAVSLAVTASASAVAAQQKIDEVVVTASPIRDSQQAAIDAKRDAFNVVDVISADTIGRFPDQNMADSLGRAPGMAIERDQGQARYINFRGTPFRYTAIGFDGIDVPGAENGRIPRFDSFPSSITSRVEINKAVLPSMPGEAVAGYINIETFNPFDREGFSLDADLGRGEQDLGNGDIDRKSLRLSWSNDNFGVMLFNSENSREQITDNQEPNLTNVDGTLQLNKIRFCSYKVKREDHAYGGHLEYRPDNGAMKRLFASHLYSEFVDKEERNHYDLLATTPVPGATVTGAAISMDNLLEYGRYDNSTETSTLGADFDLADWEVEARYNKTSTEFNTLLPIIYRISTNTDLVADYNLSNPTNVTFNLDTPLTDVNYMNFAYKIDDPLNVDADKFKLDVKRDFSFGTLQVGAQYDKREARGYVGMQFDTAAFGYGDPLNIDSFRTDQPFYYNSNNSINGVYYDNKGLRAAWEAYGSIRPTITDDQRISIDEDITAAYGMVTTETSWGDVIYGVRAERTDYTSTGTLDGQAVKVDDSFTNVLPSVHVNVDLADDVKARFSVSSGVNRPTYVEWRAAARLDAINGEITGGNPSLKAEEAWGMDASIEYYFADASILSVGAFQRYIDNVIYQGETKVDAGLYGSVFAGQTWDLKGYVNGSDGELSGLEVNFIGQAGDVSEVLQGFGVAANATWLNGEFKKMDGTKAGLPGTSDLIYNASLFYENYGFSIRLNYQYRDEWISPIEDPNEVWGETERLDLSAMYQLPWDLNGATATVYFNANNLTDETDIRYDANHLPNQVESYGKRYMMGVRINY